MSLRSVSEEQVWPGSETKRSCFFRQVFYFEKCIVWAMLWKYVKLILRFYMEQKNKGLVQTEAAELKTVL